jgi:ribosomal protein S18 acetylase RimI-like enzyme
MGIAVVKGNISHLKDCEEAVVNSELGRRYFSQTGSARNSLEKGFVNDDIFVAIDESNNCIGFVWVITNGAFHSFPYIHIIAVKSGNRGQGIGKILLQHVEDVYYQNNSKLFLVVADFNPEAKRLYESIGYTAIGDIPDLYRKGITECLMMKSKKAIYA